MADSGAVPSFTRQASSLLPSWVRRSLSNADRKDLSPAELTDRFLSCDEHAGFFSGGSSPQDANAIEEICRLTYVDQATRKSIMQVLAFAVAPSATWRAILAGLELLEHLLNKGSIELWRECARGEHFDATQRLLFLGAYTSPDDPRVTKLVRERAKKLRSVLMAKDEMLNSLRVGETSDETEEDVRPHGKTEESSSSEELTSDEDGPEFSLGYDASNGISTRETAHSRQRNTVVSEAQRKSRDGKQFAYADKAARESYQSNVISGFAVIGHNPDTSSSEDEGAAGGNRIALCATGGTPHTNRQRTQKKRSRRHHSAGDLVTPNRVARAGSKEASRSNSSPIVDLL